MPVNVTDIRFQDSYTGTYSGGADIGADFLMGCVGDFVYVTIDFNVAWSILDANFDFDETERTITIKPCGLVSGDWIEAGFQDNDTIIIEGSGSNDGTYTIVEITATSITVLQALTNESGSGINVYGASVVNSIDFYYNLTDRRQPLPTAWGPHNPLRLGQNNSFNSLTDPNALQKYTGVANTYYNGYSFMKQNSPSLAWYTSRVDGVSCRPQLTFLGETADYKQQYRIKFPFLITPLTKSDQLQLLKDAFEQSQASGVNPSNFAQPDYFTGQNSLQFIFQIDAKFTTNKAQVDHTSDLETTFKPSNLSWFNSFFPSGVYDVSGNLLTNCQYKFVSIAYTVNGDAADAIDFNEETDVLLIIGKTAGSSALVDASKFVLNFCLAPTNTTEYQNYSSANQLNFREVFLHDRAVNQAAQPAVNGDQYGTGYQAITDCSAVANAGNIEISFKINLGATSQSVFENATAGRNYLIWVTPQNSNVVEMVASNRSAILGDVNEAVTDTDDDTLLEIVTNGQPDVYFYKCDNCDDSADLASLTPETGFNDYVGGYGINWTQFKVKSGCVINSIKTSFEVQVTVAATSELLGSFPLEEWNLDTSSFWDGNINQINVDQPRNFPLATEDLRNTRKIIRNTNIDGGGYYGYDMIYGFQMGYQYWQNLVNYYKVFNRYHTNYWAVYSQGYVGKTTDPGYTRIVPVTQTTKIYFKIEWEVLDNTTEVVTTFTHYANVYCYDENGNTSGWTLTQDTTDKFGNSLSGVIQQDEPTTVVVSISGGSLATPVGYTAVGELIAYYTSGGQEVFDRIASDDAGVREGSIWEELPSLLIDTTNNVGKIVADLDPNNLEVPVENIRIYGKLTFVK